jgi:hypothetical protein
MPGRPQSSGRPRSSAHRAFCGRPALSGGRLSGWAPLSRKAPFCGRRVLSGRRGVLASCPADGRCPFADHSLPGCQLGPGHCSAAGRYQAPQACSAPDQRSSPGPYSAGGHCPAGGPPSDGAGPAGMAWPGAAEPGAAEPGAAEPGAAEPGPAEPGVPSTANAAGRARFFFPRMTPVFLPYHRRTEGGTTGAFDRTWCDGRCDMRTDQHASASPRTAGNLAGWATRRRARQASARRRLRSRPVRRNSSGAEPASFGFRPGPGAGAGGAAAVRRRRPDATFRTSASGGRAAGSDTRWWACRAATAPNSCSRTLPVRMPQSVPVSVPGGFLASVGRSAMPAHGWLRQKGADK